MKSTVHKSLLKGATMGTLVEDLEERYYQLLEEAAKKEEVKK